MKTDGSTSGNETAQTHGDTAPRLATVLLATLKRAIEEQRDLDSALSEAAAVFGLSVETVRRHINGGLNMSRHAGARQWLLPRSPADAALERENARLSRELNSTQHDLREALWENAALASELQALRADGLVQQVWSHDLHNWPLGNGAGIAAQRAERLRITAKLDEARRIAGRRHGVVALLVR
jgi:hypothetical protein